jgi:hypothetical protein
MEFVLILAIVGLFALLATRFGVDSRDGNDWLIHRSV